MHGKALLRTFLAVELALMFISETGSASSRSHRRTTWRWGNSHLRLSSQSCSRRQNEATNGLVLASALIRSRFCSLVKLALDQDINGTVSTSRCTDGVMQDQLTGIRFKEVPYRFISPSTAAYSVLSIQHFTIASAELQAMRPGSG